MHVHMIIKSHIPELVGGGNKNEKEKEKEEKMEGVIEERDKVETSK